MFTDRAVIFVRSGNGGHGIISFHREKFVAAGGPDGGDGGRGGSVIFVADTGITTLADFRYKRKYVAENGENGSKNKKTGKDGADVIVRVPQGTIVKDNKTGRILADIVDRDSRVVIAPGGKGGKGNSHFATATRQIPNFAKAGEAGVELEVVLELKLLADVGLVGFPNVGKSTILSVTTSAKPEIADYPFTTLNPHLGVVMTEDGKNFVMADIPGLIEGASEGKGAGHRFLRHVERTRLLLHVIDISGFEGRDPFQDFLLINEELEKYNPLLAARPQIIALNKCDVEGAADNLKVFREKFDAWLTDKREKDPETDRLCELGCYRIFELCAALHKGVEQMTAYVGSILPELPQTSAFEDWYNQNAGEGEFADDEELFTVSVDEDGVYEVRGRWIENVIDSVNLEDTESAQYFQRMLRQKGVIDKLEELGIQEEDLVRIKDTEFEFLF